MKEKKNKISEKKPVALILAGYNQVNYKVRKKKNKEIMEAYGHEIYIGQNKFLHDLNGKPVMHYVLDAVYNAKKNGKPLYEKIYIYNDIKSLKEHIDVTQYNNLELRQMTASVGGHWNDFYFNDIDYGQRVDVFFGDTPRIDSEDVQWIHEEYSKVLGVKKDHRGVPINMMYAIVNVEDMEDNWLEDRMKLIKRGKHKGLYKYFVYFKEFTARVGNSGAIIKDKGMDELIEKEAVNFIYNLRKALTPNILSKIFYYIWKNKHIEFLKDVKAKCMKYTQFIDVNLDILQKIYKFDLSKYAGAVLHINRHGGRWENDIDSPSDMEIFREKFYNHKKK